jgi:hypothetical protein
MRMLLTCILVATLPAIVVGCKRQDDTQQPTPVAATAPYGPYQGYPAPQATYGQYAPPPATPTYAQPYPPPPPPAQAPVQPATPISPAPAPGVSGQMAVPGPVAFQCQNDIPCGTHHCNVQYGKCAFPCQTNADCISPNSCVLGLCVPAPPPQH